MAFVEVIARDDRRVRFAQLLGERRVAFETDLERGPRQSRQREHLACDLEHRSVWTERELLITPEQRQAVIAQVCGVHWSAWRRIGMLPQPLRLISASRPG